MKWDNRGSTWETETLVAVFYSCLALDEINSKSNEREGKALFSG